jgi:hypothetical protein
VTAIGGSIFICHSSGLYIHHGGDGRTSLTAGLLSDSKLAQAMEFLEVLFRWELTQIPVKNSLE